MHSSRLLPLLAVAVVVGSLGTARAVDYPVYMKNTCSPPGNYTNDSPYGENLAKLLSTLSTPDPATVDNWWFRNHTVGTGPDQVYGLAMCYADSDAESCLNCLRTMSFEDRFPLCYHSRNVSFLSSQGCIIRYADAPFFGSADTDRSGDRLILHSFLQPADVAGMREARARLLSQLADMAGSDARRFAIGSQGYEDTVFPEARRVVYGMAQCTRDLPLSECSSCLLDHLAEIYMDGVQFINSTKASVKGFSCYLSYQLDEPINIAGMAPAPAPSPAPTEPPTGSSSAPPSHVDRTTTLIAALAAAAAVAVTILNVGV